MTTLKWVARPLPDSKLTGTSHKRPRSVTSDTVMVRGGRHIVRYDLRVSGASTTLDQRCGLTPVAEEHRQRVAIWTHETKITYQRGRASVPQGRNSQQSLKRPSATQLFSLAQHPL